MRRILSTVTLIMLIGILAACGSSGNDDEAIPTLMQLPTLSDAEATATEESAQPTATEEVAETTDTEEEPTATEEVVAGPPTTAPVSTQPPSFLQNVQRPGSSAAQESDTFVVESTQDVAVLSCADISCDVLGTLQNGEAVIVVEQDEDWFTIEFEDGEGFVDAQFLVSSSTSPFGQGSFPPGFDPAVAATQSAGLGSGNPPGGVSAPPSDSGFPPGVNPAPSTPGPSFPPAAPPGG